MTKPIIEKVKKYKEVVLSGFLWLCLWATYDTDISRFWNPGFPHNVIDLIHGVRALLPFLALIIAIIVLFKKKSLPKNIFTTPLGLIGIFTIIGVLSSLISKNPLMAIYWGVLYGSVIIVLLAFIENKKVLKNIIIINLVIAGLLAIGLTLFFFMQPGSAGTLTTNFLVCTQRPFETLGQVRAEVNTFDMSGTRPTGLGRYAGLAVIVAFAAMLSCSNRKKYLYAILFVFFFLILFFAKGKTELVAFIFAVFVVVWLCRRLKTWWVIFLCFIIALTYLITFYNIPCSNDLNFIQSFIKYSVPINSPALKPTSAEPIRAQVEQAVPAKPVEAPITDKSVKTILSLSGRTSGVWTDAWHLFIKSPLFGFGFQADRYFLNGQHAHNSLIHALLQAGILGTIPFLLAFIVIFLMLVRIFTYHGIKQDERNFLIMLSAILVFFAVRSITESVAFFSADWLFVAPIIAYIQCLDGQIRKEKDNSKMDFNGNKIDLLKISDVIGKIKYWVKNEPQKNHWIVATGMHGAVEAYKHKDFKFILSHADLWVPDGISLVWLAKLKGFDISRRIPGPDLMYEVLKTSLGDHGRFECKNYFYGDTEETLQELNKKLLTDFPNLKIVGHFSPPFRQLNAEEDEKIIEKINQANPDILWVGLGLPKQEKWIYQHRGKLKVPVIIGVGAAFKFLSGKVERGPRWIGNLGFEWLWRLVHEPKKMWKRVFVDIPIFFWMVFLDLMGFKSYK